MNDFNNNESILNELTGSILQETIILKLLTDLASTKPHDQNGVTRIRTNAKKIALNKRQKNLKQKKLTVGIISS